MRAAVGYYDYLVSDTVINGLCTISELLLNLSLNIACMHEFVGLNTWANSRMERVHMYMIVDLHVIRFMGQWNEQH